MQQRYFTKRTLDICETVKTQRHRIMCMMKLYWLPCGKLGMQVKQTSAVLYPFGVRLVRIKAIYYLYFQTRQDITFAPAVAWWRLAFHKVLGKLQKGDVYYTIKVVGAFLSHLKSEQCVCIWTRLWFMHRHTPWSPCLIPPLAGTRTRWQFKTSSLKLS